MILKPLNLWLFLFTVILSFFCFVAVEKLKFSFISSLSSSRALGQNQQKLLGQNQQKLLGQNQQKFLGLGLNSQELISRYGEPFKRVNVPFNFEFGENLHNARVQALMEVVGPRSFFVKGLTPMKVKICDLEYILFEKQDYILAFCLFNNKAEEVQVMKAYKGSPADPPRLLPPYWGWEEAEVVGFVEKIFLEHNRKYVSPDLLRWQGSDDFAKQSDGMSVYGLAPEITQFPVVDASLYNFRPGHPNYDWCLKDSEQNVFCFFVDSPHTSGFTQISNVLWVTTSKRSEMIKNKYLQIIKVINSEIKNRSDETRQKINSI